MSKRRRSARGRIASNPNTSALKAQTARRRRQLAVDTAVQLANQRAIIAARLVQANEHYPEPSTDELLAMHRTLLDKLDERLGIERPGAPTETHQPGAQVAEPQEPHGPR